MVFVLIDATTRQYPPDGLLSGDRLDERGGKIVIRLIRVTVPFVLAGLFAMTAWAEMVVRTTDGQIFTVPVEPAQVQSIEFTSAKSAQGHLADFAGVWRTTEGELILTQRGSSVIGRYAKDNGEIQGTVLGDVLSGYWIEDASNQRCGSLKNGRAYWGRIRFVHQGDRFTGKWTYCGKSPDQSDEAWNGTR